MDTSWVGLGYARVSCNHSQFSLSTKTAQDLRNHTEVTALIDDPIQQFLPQSESHWFGPLNSFNRMLSWFALSHLLKYLEDTSSTAVYLTKNRNPSWLAAILPAAGCGSALAYRVSKRVVTGVSSQEYIAKYTLVLTCVGATLLDHFWRVCSPLWWRWGFDMWSTRCRDYTLGSLLLHTVVSQRSDVKVKDPSCCLSCLSPTSQCSGAF